MLKNNAMPTTASKSGCTTEAAEEEYIRSGGTGIGLRSVKRHGRLGKGNLADNRGCLWTVAKSLLSQKRQKIPPLPL